MRWVWRALVVLAVSLGAGYGTMRLLITHAVARGAPEYSVRLGGAMGGLFVGGAVALGLSLLLLLGGRSRPEED